MKCPGSVELSEGQPDKSSPWAIEGTEAHAVLEDTLRKGFSDRSNVPPEMTAHAANAASFILGVLGKADDAELLVESRVHLPFIHPEMFGTYDGAIVDYFGTLHVFDYKYGSGHSVSPKENLQMIFYGIGLAHKFDWNFKRVRLWIIQPRIKGYDGPAFWEISILELKAYVQKFKDGVERVLDNPDLYVEGSHCHWCKAKSVCPLKVDAKIEQARLIFKMPVEARRVLNGIEEKEEKENVKTEAEWRKEARTKKKNSKRKSAAPPSKRAKEDNDDFW